MSFNLRSGCTPRSHTHIQLYKNQERHCKSMASCSHWWHAPVYFVASVVLAFIANSTALNSQSSNAARPTRPVSNYLSLNASRTLRETGFNIMATLLLLSPEMFFLSPSITIFAIKDSSPSSTSLPPWFLKKILQYHLSFETIHGGCL